VTAAVPGAPEIRRFPYPYRAMLSVSTDLDETPDRDVYWKTMCFLNTEEAMGGDPGVALEVANSVYFDMAPDQFAYWNTDDAGRGMLRDLMRSGHVDSIHSFGDLAVTRADCARTLDDLARHDCRLTVWTDHAVAPSNFGPDIMRGSGDVPGSPVFHADLSHGYGIRHVWRGRITSVTGQGVRRRLGGILDPAHPKASAMTLAKEAAKGVLARLGSPKYAPHPQNRVLQPATLRSGQRVWEFLRSNPSWGGVSHQETAPGFGGVVTPRMLDRLVHREGACVLYTHLGKVLDRKEPLPPATRRGFAELAQEHRAGRVLVTTTRRLLDYFAMREELTATVDPQGAIHLALRQGSDLGQGALQGLTVYVDGTGPRTATLHGRALPALRENPPDHTGRRSVSVPWTPLEFPRP
jgi:hypothetical protein